MRYVTAHIRQVGAAASLKGVRPLIRSRYTFPPRLPDPGRLAVPTRPVVVGAAPTRTLRLQGQAAPSFNDPLRRAAVGSLTPLDHRRLVAHYALAAQPGQVAGAATEKHGLEAHRTVNGLPDLRLLPDAPVPDGRTVLTGLDAKASGRTWVTGGIWALSYWIRICSSARSASSNGEPR